MPSTTVAIAPLEVDHSTSLTVVLDGVNVTVNVVVSPISIVLEESIEIAVG